MPFPYKIILLLFAGFCALTYADLVEFGDSGVKGPSYEKILQWTDRLAVQYPDLVRVEDYGTSVGGKPLRLMTVMRSRQFAAPRSTMIMTGSTHGNEYLNIEDRLPEEILKKSNQSGPIRDYLDRGGAYIFVPILNPDGYTRRQRNNLNDVDLNRDWDLPKIGHNGFKETETRALSETLERYRTRYNLDFDITVDYHCCAGALLTPWGYTADNMPEPDLTQHHTVGALAKPFLNTVTGATGQVLGYYPVGTTKDYYYSRYGSISFTYEGRFGQEQSKLPQHLSWWESMANYLNQRSASPLALYDRLLSSIDL